jgi:hypothetical protein
MFEFALGVIVGVVGCVTYIAFVARVEPYR